MSLWRFGGPAILWVSAAACFDGNDARGLECRNDDQCGTELACIRQAPDDDVGICGGGDPTTVSSTGDTSDTDESTGPGPLACGVALPAWCEGVPALARPTFDTLSLPDADRTGNIAVAIGRFVGSDEWEDVAVLNLFQSEVVVYRNDAGAGFTSLTDSFQTLSSPFDMAGGDFDCDGHGDLAVVNLGEGQLAFAYGAGITLEPFDIANALDAPNPWSIAVADFDPSSEAPDLVIGCDSTSLRFDNQGDRTFGEPIGIVSGFVPWSVTAGDLDDDGIPDVVVANSEQYDYEDGDDDDFITIALSTRGFAGQAYGPASLTNPMDVGVLELDGAPGADLVVLSKHINADQTVSTLNGTLSFHANDGSGNFSPTRADVTVGIGAGTLTTADFNCDGATDIAVGHDADSVVWILWGPDHTAAGHTEVGAGASAGTRLEVADLDHDGYPDLAIPDFGRVDAKGLTIEDGGLTIVWGARP